MHQCIVEIKNISFNYDIGFTVRSFINLPISAKKSRAESIRAIREKTKYFGCYEVIC